MMKKISAIIVSLCIILTSWNAISEEIDPIIGCWYANLALDGEVTIPGYENYTREIVLLTFEKSGEITRCAIDYDGGIPVVSGPAIVGKWEKAYGEYYNISVLAAGKSTAYIADGVLFAMAIVKNYFYGFHKMDDFDWYSEMYYSNK